MSAPTPLSDRADVVVVGGGVIGIATALELARRGVSVTVLERDRLGHACSYGNAGWLTPSLAYPLPAPGLIWKATKWLFDPESPLYIQPRLDLGLATWLARFLAATRRSRFEPGTRALVELCRASLDAWRELAEAGHEFGFQQVGLLAVYEQEEALADARSNAELMTRCGVEHQLWSPDEVRTREPAIVGPQVGAYYFPGDAHCEPYPAVGALAREAEAAGVTFVEEAEVFAVERTGGRVDALVTTRGRLRGDQVVVATGSWSKSFGRLLELELPVLGAKGYTLVMPRQGNHPRHSLMLAGRKIAINPHADALRVSGTLELVDEDLSITRRRVDAIVRAARGMLELPEPLEPVELWRGLRPCTPDGLPMIGKARRGENVWIHTGHQMTGLKTAPASGRLLAQLMTGETPSFDPTPFRADRY